MISDNVISGTVLLCVRRMTNTATALRTGTSRIFGVVDQRKPLWTTTVENPPTPPPPPLRARARGMVRPVTRRRAPAVPPPSVPAVEYSLDDMLDLDPVIQNERNDVIWQRRHEVVVTSGDHQQRRIRRCASPAPSTAWVPRCQQCRHVDETKNLPPPSSHARVSDLVALKPVNSRADNEYVEEPSTVPDTVTATTSSLHLRLPSKVDTPAVPVRLKDSDAGSSTSLRTAVTHNNAGVMCKLCRGCRCASCQSSVLQLCTGRGVVGGRGSARSAVRTMLGACLCHCLLWSVSSCHRRCTNAPPVCRCRADSL